MITAAVPRVPASAAAFIALLGALLIYWSLVGLGLLKTTAPEQVT